MIIIIIIISINITTVIKVIGLRTKFKGHDNSKIIY